MAAVTLKLSARDAGYLIQMLDAVAAASQDFDSSCREHPNGPGSNDGRPVRCTDCASRVAEKRSQSLRDAGPFGDFKSNRAFALRVGATLLSAKNIADAHNE